MEDIIGMVKLFAGTYAPQNWAFCDGSLLPIRQYTALFSILGNNYGGDGKVTFALPDLRGRVAVGGGMGQNPRWPNLNVEIGEQGGTNTETLINTEMPVHIHVGNINAIAANATTNMPLNNMLGQSSGEAGGEAADVSIYTPYSSGVQQQSLGNMTALPAGGNQPHSNMQPFLGMYYIICMEGIFPQRP